MNHEINLGMRLHDTPEMSFTERLQYIHNQGFSCAHVALAKVFDSAMVQDSALTPGFGMSLKKNFINYKVDFAVLGCYLNLANPNKKQLQDIKNRYLAHIRLAAIAGCGVVGTETGAPNEDYTFVPECHTKEAYETFRRELQEVVSYAEKMGVVVAIEPVYTHIIHTPKRARQLLDDISSPNLQIILDPMNLLHISNYENREEIIQEAIELLGKEVAVLHLKDFLVSKDSLQWVAPGEGMMDYGPVMKFIKQSKPFIHCTLEDTVPENAMKAAEYIRQIYAEA